MPLHRLAGAHRLCAANRGTFNKAAPCFRSLQLVRWKSEISPQRGRSITRILLYGLTGTGLAMGATLTYANYDPAFKNKTDTYVPGFAALAAFTADKWVALTDFINPKTNVGLKGEKERVRIGPVFGSVKPKEEQKMKDLPSDKREEKVKESETETPRDPELEGGKDPDKSPKEIITKPEEVIKAEVLPPIISLSEPQEQQLAVPPAASGSLSPEASPIEPPEQLAVPPAASGSPSPEASPIEPPEQLAVPPAASGSPSPEAGPIEPPEQEHPVSKLSGEPMETTASGPEGTATAAVVQPEEEGSPSLSVESAVASAKEETARTSVESVVASAKEETARTSVESAVASAKEETARTTEEIISEQIREHQEAQTSDEHFQWLKDSTQVEAKLQEAYEAFVSISEKVLEAQRVVTGALKEHHQKLLQTTKAPAEGEHVDIISGNVAISEEAVEVAKKDLQSAQLEHKETVSSLKSLLEQAMDLGLRSKVAQIESKMAGVVTDLLTGTATMAEVETDSKVLEEYQREAQRSKEQLQRELGTSLPEADTQQEALVMLLQRRVDVLKHKLEEVEREQKQKLGEALEKQKESLEKLAEDKLKWRLQQQDHDYQQGLQRKVEEVARQYESELREQLRIQTDTHTQHLAEAMQTQADQLTGKWVSELEQKLYQQESYYQKELARAMARLRGIETMVNTVADAGLTTQKQQSLRTACDTLSDALQQANSNPDTSQKYRFSSEVASIRDTAEGNHFILHMLDSIPQEARDGGGIQSEASLKERFRKVKRICKRVALVPETGGGLGTYALSYLQSLLTLNIWSSYVIDTETNPAKMDTFQLLHQAEAYLHHGELEKAVCHVNLLQGEARRVARDWLCDARLYLETRQAVELILHYMAATSISMVQTK